MKQFVPAIEFRRRARLAMKHAMSVLLVVALIATLPSLLGSVVTMITEATPTTVLNALTNRSMQLMEKYGLQSANVEEVLIDEAALQADIVVLMETYLQDMETFVHEKGPIMAATTLAVLVISPMMCM